MNQVALLDPGNNGNGSGSMRLVSEAFLIRTPNAKDKRTYDIVPTEKAWAAYPFVKQQIDDCFHHMTRQMTEQEQEEFRRLLMLAAETTIAQDD